jgi:hypothetical protein
MRENVQNGYTGDDDAPDARARTHDYARHGVTSLFAAFGIADGTADIAPSGS